MWSRQGGNKIWNVKKTKTKTKKQMETLAAKKKKKKINCCFKLRICEARQWWCMPLIPAHGRQRHADF
jgi:hypothetical protein